MGQSLAKVPLVPTTNLPATATAQAVLPVDDAYVPWAQSWQSDAEVRPSNALLLPFWQLLHEDAAAWLV
jgi:hypothetical protein